MKVKILMVLMALLSLPTLSRSQQLVTPFNSTTLNNMLKQSTWSHVSAGSFTLGTGVSLYNSTPSITDAGQLSDKQYVDENTFWVRQSSASAVASSTIQLYMSTGNAIKSLQDNPPVDSAVFYRSAGAGVSTLGVWFSTANAGFKTSPAPDISALLPGNVTIDGAVLTTSASTLYFRLYKKAGTIETFLGESNHSYTNPGGGSITLSTMTLAITSEVDFASGESLEIQFWKISSGGTSLITFDTNAMRLKFTGAIGIRGSTSYSLSTKNSGDTIGNKLTYLSTPTISANGDLASKQYVDEQVAASSGTGGSTGTGMEDIFADAGSFTTAGQGQSASINSIEYQVAGDSEAVYAVTFPDAAPPNFAKVQRIVPYSWTDGICYGYIVFTSSGETAGKNAWLDIRVSSQAFLANSYTEYGSTTAFATGSLVGAQYEVMTATFTIPAGSLFQAGNPLNIKLFRPQADPSIHDVRVFGIRISKTKLWAN